MTLRFIALLYAAAASADVAMAEDKRQFDPWETTQGVPDYLQHRQCYSIRGLATAVPDKAIAAAEQILGQDAAVPIDDGVLRKLFSSGRPELLTLSEKAADAHDATAAKEEQDLRGTQHFRGADYQRYVKYHIAEARYFAEYLRLTAHLRKPFLVRGVMLSGSTDGFDVIECAAHALWVAHGSMGRSWPKPKRMPLVVFLLSDPKSVYVTTSMAE